MELKQLQQTIIWRRGCTKGMQQRVNRVDTLTAIRQKVAIVMLLKGQTMVVGGCRLSY